MIDSVLLKYIDKSLGSKNQKMRKQKLILNLNDKNKNVVHIRTVQFYLKHGLKIKEDA